MAGSSIGKPSSKAVHARKSAAGAAKKASAPEASTVAAKKNAVTKKVVKPRAPAPVEVAPVKAVAEPKLKRAKKEKVVRDSFTMPKSDYDKIAAVKEKCLAAGVSAKKSEILRAGLLLLESATPKRLLAAVAAVEQVKTGRPSEA